MSKEKSKAATQPLPVPQNDLEATNQIAEIGRLAREIAGAENFLNNAIAELTKTAAEKVEPLQKQRQALIEGLQIYCSANRARLTDAGKTKTADFSTGKVAWRLRPAKVSLRNVAEVIRIALERGLRQFVREKFEVDKDAMLANKPLARTIPGVSIGSEGEDFIVEPAEVEIAEQAS